MELNEIKESKTNEPNETEKETETKRKKRKPGRRSNTKVKNNFVDIKIIQSNVDGYTTKKESINDIAKDEAPDVMTLNDTNLKGKLKVKVPDYFSYVKNREQNKGGVATVIANHLKSNVMKVAEGREGDEYIITRFDHTIPAMNIVNMYGQNESRTDNDEIEKTWIRLMQDVKEIEERNETVLIVGDLNKAIGNDEFGVKGNKSKISPGGKLIRNLIKNHLYIVINNLDLVKDGPWTWVDRKDSNVKSCLDIGIMSAALLPYLTEVEVDINKKFTPRRVINNKKKKTIYTDHYSLKIQFRGIPRVQEFKKPESSWNRGKPGGWEVYKRMTNESSEKIREVISNEKNIDEAMKKIEALDTKIKFKSFGKTKNSLKKNPQSRLCRCDPSQIGRCKTCKTQKDKDEELLARQSKKIELAIEKIKASKQGRAGNIFQMRKEIMGPKNGGQDASAIRDPDNGELIVNKEEIKRATLKYCVNNLKNNKPDNDVKDIVNERKEKQKKMMNDKTGESFEITFDDFDQVMAKFERKDTTTYDFLIKAGEKYKYAIYEICKRIIHNEEIPDQFHQTILVMIWKHRGNMEVLKNNRFLHMQIVLARVVDCLVVNKMKEPLISRLSIYQVGGLPGHSIHEHLLTIKTILARLEELGEGLIFFVMDIISFFDKEDIFDCLETMEKLQINKKAARLWYLLNQNTRIKVKTAFGLTEEAEVGDCLAQGTSGAGLISAANLCLGLQKEFNNCTNVMKFDQVRIQPLSYQDDVGSICSNVQMVKHQAKKMSQMLKVKILEAHPEKSGILIMGSKKYKKEVGRQLEETSIYLNKFQLKTKENYKYLGQVFQSNLSESALATVQEKAGKIKGAALEVKSVIEDFQMQAMGGLVAAWELWERALVPSLLAGAGTWLGDIREAVKLCNKLQAFYWRVILGVPESCPKLALICETKMTDMKWRIWEEKCLFLLRIKSLEEGSLAKTIHEVAEDKGWPGLGREVRNICQMIGISDLNTRSLRTNEIKQAIAKSHFDNMMSQFEGSKKLQDIKMDNFQHFQDYFNDKNLESARMKFRIRTKMVKDIPGNFKNKFKNTSNGLTCSLCPSEMTQNHCIICPERVLMRQDLVMTDLDDLVIYFKRILSDKDKSSHN